MSGQIDGDAAAVIGRKDSYDVAPQQAVGDHAVDEDGGVAVADVDEADWPSVNRGVLAVYLERSDVHAAPIRYHRFLTYYRYATYRTDYARWVGTVKSRREQYAEQTRQACSTPLPPHSPSAASRSTSIDDIAASAQVTKGAVYLSLRTESGNFLQAVLNRCDEAAKVQVFAAVSDHPEDLWAGMLAA